MLSKSVMGLVAIGVVLRIIAMVSSPLGVDEAESAINALTILDHGVPVDDYLGQPIFENTLTELSPDNSEYEFRDSSYSPKGLAVYHGWLPIYAIAAAERLAGFKPDIPSEEPVVRHGSDQVLVRTMVPRIPSILFSIGFMLVMFVAAREISGTPAAWAALTWSAVALGAVNRGHQARYYSLTLLLSSLFILIFFRVYRNGRMRDFCWLGIVEGLLFHTHQLSALVAAIVAALGIGRIHNHKGWLLKSVVSGLIASVLIVPWIALTGFMDTADSVPKAHQIFVDYSDWISYALSQKREIVIGIAGLMLIFFIESFRGKSGCNIDKSEFVKSQTLLLFGWSVCAFFSFHAFMPAASFFSSRLSLTLITPYVLLVSSAIGAFFTAFFPRLSNVGAVLSMIIIVVITSAGPRIPHPSKNQETIGRVLTMLQNRSFAPGTRFYAEPNIHLVWTYYSGLPVQSFAPVRKSFFDDYPSTIIYLENHLFTELATESQIRKAAEANHKILSSDEIQDLKYLLWQYQVTEDLESDGFQLEPVVGLPKYMVEVDKLVRVQSLEKVKEHLSLYGKHPMFKGIEFQRPKDLWTTFFYRFSNYEDRLGRERNIYERLLRSRVIIVPESEIVIYESPPLHPLEETLKSDES